MVFLSKPNVKIYYETYGKVGPWVVLINGYTRSCSDFKQLANFLWKRGYRVLLFDNRGSGRTRSHVRYSLEDIASDLFLLTNELEIEKVHLIGFSMGGIVARVFIHKYPTKVQTLSLIASPFDASFLKDNNRSVWSDDLVQIEAKLSTYVSVDFIKKNPLMMRILAKQIYDQVKDNMLVNAQEQQCAMEQTINSFYSIRGLSQKILIIHGDQDKIVPISHAYRLKDSHLRVKLKILAGVGHLILLENTEQLYETVFSFLEKNSEL